MKNRVQSIVKRQVVGIELQNNVEKKITRL